MLTRWAAFMGFLSDRRICFGNNAAERDLRRVAVGHRDWTFAGSDEGDPPCCGDALADQDLSAQRPIPTPGSLTARIFAEHRCSSNTSVKFARPCRARRLAVLFIVQIPLETVDASNVGKFSRSFKILQSQTTTRRRGNRCVYNI
jgi:Transposase IS66 family